MMKRLVCILLASIGTAAADSVAPVGEDRWPPDKAAKWYRSQPWPCGFNYIPANAISYTEMWMPYCFDPKRIDRELALAEDIGFKRGLAVWLF